jgi:cytosolic carboxypeptidase protein 2/3
MSRVHPGETNASVIAKGIIEYLVSDEANKLRDRFIFKIIPMLNPDGVRYGNYRDSLFGADLNRKWIDPDILLSTSLYLTKKMI